MGGNAFDNTNRISKDDYRKLTIYFIKLFNKIDSQQKFYYRIPVYNVDKVDHGDMDIIISSHNNGKLLNNVLERIEKENIIKKHKNSNCLSLAISGNIINCAEKMYQIDVITCHPSVYKINCLYYGTKFWMVYGKMLHKYGLSMCQTGLRVKFDLTREHVMKWIVGKDLYSDKINIPKKERYITVSQNPQHIVEFLGIHCNIHDKWSTNRDIYNVLLRNKFNIYANGKNIRNIKKEHMLYSVFKESNKYKLIYDNYDIDIRMSTIKHFNKCDKFVKWKSRIKNIAYIQKLKQDANSKFSHKDISELFNINGQELGKVMVVLKKKHKKYYEWILETDIEKIKESICEIINS